MLIGKDTRRSGYMLETALTAGFTSVGMDVFLVGPVPTPAVGMLARSMRADLGVMISASHNPFQDNGIKFFGPDGFKLSDAAEEAIEALLEGEPALAEPTRIGRATRIDDGRGRYMEFAKTTFPRGQRLDGLKVVVDCANGAAYRTAPEVLWELGAEVVPIGVKPDGFNINAGVRLDPHRGGGRGGPGARRRPRHQPRRRRRPGDDHRRDRRGRRRRPVHGADRRPLGRRGPARQGHAGRHGDVEPRARAPSRGAGAAAASAPRSATATSSRRCARAATTSAASSRGTS